MLRQLVRDEQGAVITEYGLIAALLGLVTIGSIFALSNALRATFLWWSSNM